jgi:hypothetical protein
MLSNDYRTPSEESFPDVDFINESLQEFNVSDDSLKVTEFRLKEMSAEFKPEPLLNEDKSRFVLFPIKHQDVSNLLRII